jgi:dihydroorotate dehydrogenase electron transfer subunit
MGPVTEILYKVVGKGTQALSQVTKEQKLKILGPLGRGFVPTPGAKHLVGVAGGYGIAPFWELAAQLREGSQGLKLFYGARSTSDLIYLEQLQSLDVELHLSTEDGSKGHKGLITEVLAREHEEVTPDWVGACGPMGLLYAVGRWSEQMGISAQLSVEEAMGCGTGVCLGCVVKDREGHYRRACVEGPVMSSQLMEIRD